MSTSGPAPQPAPAPVAADIGVVAALKIEVAPLLARLTNVRKYSGSKVSVIEGEIGGKIIAVVLTGMGRPRAQRGAEVLLAGHRPRWPISAGFAGGLDPALARNTLVLPNEVVNLAGRRFAIDVAIPAEAHEQGLRTGCLLTADEIILNRAAKVKLRQEHRADLVDMETSAVAALCGERGVKFLSVRVISDEAESEPSPEILAIISSSSSMRACARKAPIPSSSAALALAVDGGSGCVTESSSGACETAPNASSSSPARVTAQAVRDLSAATLTPRSARKPALARIVSASSAFAAGTPR